MPMALSGRGEARTLSPVCINLTLLQTPATLARGTAGFLMEP